jgi:hypothetical protein
MNQYRNDHSINFCVLCGPEILNDLKDSVYMNVHYPRCTTYGGYHDGLTCVHLIGTAKLYYDHGPKRWKLCNITRRRLMDSVKTHLSLIS